jgi:hypothetical protein
MSAERARAVAPAAGSVLEDLPVCEVFDRLSWEIELAAARCLLVDKVVGQMVELLPGDRAGFLETLHGVDLLHQHLQGLAVFSRTLSQRASKRARVSVVDALDAVTLGSVVERLRASMGAFVDPDEPAAGDVDLF